MDAHWPVVVFWYLESERGLDPVMRAVAGGGGRHNYAPAAAAHHTQWPWQAGHAVIPGLNSITTPASNEPQGSLAGPEQPA